MHDKIQSFGLSATDAVKVIVQIFKSTVQIFENKFTYFASIVEIFNITNHIFVTRAQTYEKQ